MSASANGDPPFTQACTPCALPVRGCRSHGLWPTRRGAASRQGRGAMAGTARAGRARHDLARAPAGTHPQKDKPIGGTNREERGGRAGCGWRGRPAMAAHVTLHSLLEFEEEGGGAGGYAKVMSEEFIKAEMELFAEQARDVDIIVTTALIPGKPAPKLITEEMVHSMRDGSVIVDLAAEQGGNCELTKPGEICKSKGVTIIGFTDLPSRLATQSSQLFATNLRHLISDMTPEKEGQLQFDFL